MKQEEIAEFYDQYSERQEKIGVNERLISLYERLKKLGLNSNSQVLELGCGVGAFTHLLSKKVTIGKVEAVDLSPESISSAKKRIKKGNIQFYAADVVHYAPVHRAIDFVLLMDVIEHIPIELHSTLFENIAKYITQNTLICINIPNPEYLKYVHIHQPENLQVIDQPIETDFLINTITKAGLELLHFEKYHIWEREDYHFLVLRKKQEFSLKHRSSERNLVQKIEHKLKRTLDRMKYR